MAEGQGNLVPPLDDLAWFLQQEHYMVKKLYESIRAEGQAGFVLPQNQLDDLAWFLQQEHYVVEKLHGSIRVNTIEITLVPPFGCVEGEGDCRAPLEEPGNRPWRYCMSGFMGQLWEAEIFDTQEDVLKWLTGNPLMDS